MIKKYQEKMKFRFLYSYLNFMEVISEDFVQIEVDTMIRKDKFQIDNDLLCEFNNKLNLIFTKYDSIDTRTFNGYLMFPKLSYNWNKYLLVGIIRTFLNKQYKVENTDYQYRLTDYIIRKIN